MKAVFSLFIIMALAGCNIPEPQPYFIFLNTNPDREALPDSIVSDLQTRHLANIDSLAKAGIITAAGPFEGGGGIFILQANNMKHANKILQTDPAIRANRFKIEILPLKFVVGDNCKYSEPVEMITLGFFRFITNDSYLPPRQIENFKERLSSIANDTGVLVLAEFDKKGNGFMILNHEMTEEWSSRITNDPVFQDGTLDLSYKNLWIANGTFCRLEED